MSRTTERLVAVDGVNGNALLAAARHLLAGSKRRQTGISSWDASGIFGEVVLADAEAGLPSARTLVLLYAADLAFRLRWEIRPSLAAGRRVIAVPYVDTAVAFGRAAGLDGVWLADLFSFAPQPANRQYVYAPAARSVSDRKGFVEFSCQQMAGAHTGAARLELIQKASRSLKGLEKQNLRIKN